jgi:hypothetical protein
MVWFLFGFFKNTEQWFLFLFFKFRIMDHNSSSILSFNNNKTQSEWWIFIIWLYKRKKWKKQNFNSKWIAFVVIVVAVIFLIFQFSNRRVSLISSRSRCCLIIYIYIIFVSIPLFFSLSLLHNFENIMNFFFKYWLRCG